MGTDCETYPTDNLLDLLSVRGGNSRLTGWLNWQPQKFATSATNLLLFQHGGLSSEVHVSRLDMGPADQLRSATHSQFIRRWRMVKALCVFLLAILFSVLPHSARAALVEDFYKGKTVQFIVGGTAGGGYDAYTRLIARHFPQYVPGKPSTVVQNMPGAAMLIAANYTYNSAPRDGTVIGHWSGPLILQHLMGNPAVQFEGRKFGWLGMPTADSLVCITTDRSGIKTAEDWRNAKTRVKLGAIG